MEVLRIPFSKQEYFKLSQLIEQTLGIRMPPIKKDFLKARLSKRLKELNISSYTDYYTYITSPEGRTKEIRYFTDTITTNKTDFFREEKHFTYLIEVILPNLKSGQKVNIWSAGCATGEEPYTMAMVLEYYKVQSLTQFIYSIHATDISVYALSKAFKAVYSEQQISPIPEKYKKLYLMKHKNNVDKYRIDPEIRSKISFRQLNLFNYPYKISKNFDIIFCRNVLIYFDRENQNKIINYLLNFIKPEGYLFVGHAETLFEQRDHLINVAPSIYRKAR